MKLFKLALGLGLAILIQGCADQVPSGATADSKAQSVGSVDGDNLFDPGLNERVVDKKKCRFDLRGANGATWFVERYLLWDDSCDLAVPTVLANNPNAQIIRTSSNYVHDATVTAFKTKCTYSFRGANNSRWISERYLDDGIPCSSEDALVRANNPNAQILSVVANFVHDATIYASKNKCTFQFRGQGGAEWFSERYIDSALNCNSELATVRANNPNAQILAVIQNFVHDPY